MLFRGSPFAQPPRPQAGQQLAGTFFRVGADYQPIAAGTIGQNWVGVPPGAAADDVVQRTDTGRVYLVVVTGVEASRQGQRNTLALQEITTAQAQQLVAGYSDVSYGMTATQALQAQQAAAEAVRVAAEQAAAAAMARPHLPSGAGAWPAWNWDDRESIDLAHHMFPGIHAMPGDPGQCAAFYHMSEFDPNRTCTATVNGRTFQLPCDLAPEPRPPSAEELGKWWYAAVGGRVMCNSWAVANGMQPFDGFVAPDGKRYGKYYNGDTVLHWNTPPNTVTLRELGPDLGMIISDVGDFIARNICLIGRVTLSVAATPAAGTNAGAVCQAITGPGSPGAPANSPLVMVIGTATVYYVENGVRHVFPDIETFELLGFKWNQIREISAVEMAHIPEGPPVPSRKPGATVPGPVAPGPGTLPAPGGGYRRPVVVPWYEQPVVWGVGGVAIVGAIAFVVIKSRRRAPAAV